MKANGIPEEQIIVFSYDDVADSSSNKFKGKLYNRPDGEDVYEGCVVEYKGTDNTPENFLKVLQGEDMNGKRTLKTNRNSKVFINFSDHGSAGLIAFPSKSLYAKDFISTLESMHAKDLYGEMAIYIEACYSGSMFEGLLSDDLRIYATTAANSHESSWGFYCSPNDMVNGEHVGSCLGDEYSITWMEDSDSHDACSETMGEQFDTVLTKVSKSHVMEFGDLSIKAEPIGNFEGVCDAKDTSVVDYLLAKINRKADKDPEANPVNSRDIKMHYLYTKYLESGDKADALALQHEILERQAVETRFEKVQMESNALFLEKPMIMDHDCLKATVETYVSVCGYNEYDLKFYYHFVNLCNSMTVNETTAIAGAMC